MIDVFESLFDSLQSRVDGIDLMIGLWYFLANEYKRDPEFVRETHEEIDSLLDDRIKITRLMNVP